MSSLKLQKRLAASGMKCGRNKVWLDPQRDQRDCERQLEAEHPQAHQGRSRDQEARGCALEVQGQGEYRGQEEGQAHRLRKEERYKGCPNAAEAAMDEAYASAAPPPPPVSRGQEDRPPPLPRALPEGEGQRVQEQACPHGVHPQEEGREGQVQDADGPGRGQEEQGQGGQEAQGGEAGAEEGRDAPELPEGGGAAGSSRRGAAEEVGARKRAQVLLFAFTSANRKMINIHT